MTLHHPDRLHGLDAVRGLALTLGVVLHGAMAFLPGPPLWLVTDIARSTALSVTFFVIHMARMTVFFVLAGFFARVLLQRDGWRTFAIGRLKRIGLPLLLAWPFVFGAIIVVLVANAPPGAARGAGGGLTLSRFPLTHLWFLYVLLWCYAGLLLLRAAVYTVDRSGVGRTVVDRVMRRAGPWAPVLLALPVAWVLSAEPYWMMWFGVPTPDTGLLPNRPALLTYGLAFVFGFVLHRVRDDVLPRVRRAWVLWLAVAVASSVYCLSVTSLEPVLLPLPFGAEKRRFAIAYALGLWGWTFALVGIGLRFWDTASRWRRYLADASYWVYLAHLPLVLALQLLMRDWRLPWTVKFALLVSTAMVLLLLSYHWLVRDTALGALLNGRRIPRRDRPTTPIP